MWSWYLRELARRPLLTGMWSTAGMFFTGDCFAQQVVERKNEHDWSRSARMSLIGGFLVGPTIRTWYLCLDKIFGGSMTITTAAKKLLLDQLIFAPSFLATFILVNNVLQRNSLQTVLQQLRSDYTSIVVTNWTVWVPVQILNFSLIPLHHRLMFSNVIALLWNTYLSYKANSQDFKAKEVSI